MRHIFNHFLPVVEDDMNGFTLRTSFPREINYISSSNGYYGYQPAIKKNPEVREEQMETQDCHVDIQFNNYIEKEVEDNKQIKRDKKRRWDCTGGQPDSKKRREDAPTCFQQQTRNVVPEILLTQNQINANSFLVKKENNLLLEEMLEATHGCRMYHWHTHEI